MKYVIASFLAILLVAGGCGRKAMKKEAEAEPQAALQPSVHHHGGFFQEIVPGMEGEESVIKLNIPLHLDPPEAQADSVYFRGMKDMLRPVEADGHIIYKAKFRTQNGEKATAPMELQPNEAAVVIRLNGERHVLKLSPLEEKEPVFAP